MLIELLKSKIHGAHVTLTDLHYEGSIALPANLKRAAGLFTYEKVSIFNVTTGARFDTYVLQGDAEPGKVEVNGAAARLTHVGDVLIIVSYAMLPVGEAGQHKPVIVIVDGQNQPT